MYLFYEPTSITINNHGSANSQKDVYLSQLQPSIKNNAIIADEIIVSNSKINHQTGRNDITDFDVVISNDAAKCGVTEPANGFAPNENNLF
ncbi:MAG TPA: hypothetical protein VKR53_05375 [Puia sp.]|nr:hypothetical protein [Puia sp.]